jgi:hypothetical protein
MTVELGVLAHAGLVALRRAGVLGAQVGILAIGVLGALLDEAVGKLSVPGG